MQHAILATLICGIMPGLMGLSNYIVPTQKVTAAEKTIDNIKYMQELSKEVCDATSIGISTTLIDLRDDSDYTVAKLSDGKCWMTQNLRFSRETLATTGHSEVLTDADTDVTSDYILPESGAWTSGDDAAQGIIASTNDSYGAYYTWCAATAGCRDASGNNPGARVDAVSSICPKGWRLPKGTPGTGTNEFAVVAGFTSISIASGTNYWSSVSSKSFVDNVFTVNGSTWLAAGAVNSGDSSAFNAGFSGCYWSSTASGPDRVYTFSFKSGEFYPAAGNPRRYGRSVRCISADIPEVDLPKDNIPSYPPIVKDRGSADVVAVIVPPVISIDAATGANVEVDPNIVSTNGTITAKISANTNYVVQLSTTQTSLLDPNMPENPGIPASSNVIARTNGWGIKNDDDTYSAITTTPTTYYNTTTTNEDLSTTHTFRIGVSVSPTLPTGTYSTTVTVTAVNN